MGKILADVTGAIGNTPIVQLSRLTADWGLDGTIFAKLEYLNPGFSKKDRIALQIMTDAKAQGLLQPGQTVVELTSGNTGTGLAIVCSVLGHPFIAVMSQGNSPERADMMRALGAEVVLVPQVSGGIPGHVSGADLALVEVEAQRLTAQRQAYRVSQFTHPSNVIAHERHTAAEIWHQTAGCLDGFVDFAGTGGSFAGCARGLKAYNNSIRCYLVEPAGAPVLSGAPVTDPSHAIQGGGYNMPLPLVDPDLVHGYVRVTDREAKEAARRLARTEGIFAGYSSGANLAAARKLLLGAEAGKRIVVLINDSGLKYLSTDLFRP